MSDEEFFVVGLNAKTTGRSCRNHAKCGQQIKSGDILCFRGVPTVVRKKKGRGIAAVLMKDSSETCRVGFLNTSYLPREAELEGAHVLVLSVLSDDANQTPITSDREVYHSNKGGCRVKMIAVEKEADPKAKKRKLQQTTDASDSDNE